MKWLVWLLMGWSGAAFAETSAHIHWTLHGDSHIVTGANELKRVVAELPSVFGSVEGRVSEVARDAPLESYLAQVGAALETLKHTPDPHLILSLSSHGGPGFVCRQGKCADLPHKELMEGLKEQLRQHGGPSGPIRTTLLYDACHAGSLLEHLGDVSGLKLSVLNASPANQLAHGNEFPLALRAAARQLSAVEAQGPLFPDTLAVDRLGRMVSSFITSRYDQPTFWSNLGGDRDWTPERFRRALVNAPHGVSLSHAVVGDVSQFVQGEASQFARESGQFYGHSAAAALLLDAVEPADRVRRAVDLATLPSLDRRGRGLIAAWLEFDPALAGGREIFWTQVASARPAGVAELREAMGEVQLARLRTLEAEGKGGGTLFPGPFPSFAKFLRTLESPTVPSWVVAAIESTPVGEVASAVERFMKNPEVPPSAVLELGVWAEALPTELVDRQQLSQWESARLGNRNPEMGHYHRSRIQADAYTARKDAEALLALYRSVPARRPDGHQNLSSIVLREAYLDLLQKERVDVRFHTEAMTEIFSQTEPSYSQASFWLSRTHAVPNRRMIERLFDLKMVDHLLERFNDRPAALKGILNTVEGMERGASGEEYKDQIARWKTKYGSPEVVAAIKSCPAVFARVR